MDKQYRNFAFNRKRKAVLRNLFQFMLFGHAAVIMAFTNPNHFNSTYGAYNFVWSYHWNCAALIPIKEAVLQVLGLAFNAARDIC